MDAASILAAEEARFPTANIADATELSVDAGALLCVDSAPLDPIAFSSSAANREQILRERARDAMQVLASELWSLPVERNTLDVVAHLPARKTVIPRMTKAPVPQKVETRYEAYLKTQGETKRTKRERWVFDEATGEQRPRWGLNRAGSQTDEWVIEHKNSNEHTQAVIEGIDPFTLKKKQKRERVQLQRERQVRNMKDGQRSMGTLSAGLGGVAKAPSATQAKKGLEQALAIAQRSSASLGKYDNRLAGEKAPRRPVKYAPVAPAGGGSEAEQMSSMKVLDRVLRGPVGSTAADVVSHGKAANQAVTQHSRKRAGQMKKGGGRRRT